MSSSSSFASSSASKRSRPSGQQPKDAKKKRPFFECEVCELEFNSATNFAAHMKGKKHEEKKKGYKIQSFSFLVCYFSKYNSCLNKVNSSSASVVAQADVSAASDMTLTDAFYQAFSKDLTSSSAIEYNIVAFSTQEAPAAQHSVARPLSDTFSSPTRMPAHVVRVATVEVTDEDKRPGPQAIVGAFNAYCRYLMRHSSQTPSQLTMLREQFMADQDLLEVDVKYRLKMTSEGEIDLNDGSLKQGVRDFHRVCYR